MHPAGPGGCIQSPGRGERRCRSWLATRGLPQTSPDRVAEAGMAELIAELALLGTFDGRDWSRPTDCVGWDVHDLTAHLVGEYEEIARPWVLLRRLRKGHRRHPRRSRLDAHNRGQVAQTLCRARHRRARRPQAARPPTDRSRCRRGRGRGDRLRVAHPPRRPDQPLEPGRVTRRGHRLRAHRGGLDHDAGPLAGRGFTQALAGTARGSSHAGFRRQGRPGP